MTIKFKVQPGEQSALPCEHINSSMCWFVNQIFDLKNSDHPEIGIIKLERMQFSIQLIIPRDLNILSEWMKRTKILFLGYPYDSVSIFMEFENNKFRIWDHTRNPTAESYTVKLENYFLKNPDEARQIRIHAIQGLVKFMAPINNQLNDLQVEMDQLLEGK